MNTNFGEGDFLMTNTYPDEEQPEDYDRAYRDIRNFLEAVRRLRRRRGLSELKYIYSTEITESAERGERYHHHVVLSGDGLTREEVEKIWRDRTKGRCNTKRAQPDKKHLSGWANYITIGKRERSIEKDGKNPQRKASRRRWNASRNLRQPAETVADKKISVRKAGQIAEATLENAREIFATLYPDCELRAVTVRRSRWAAGVYVYAQLRKRSARGKGVEKDWLFVDNFTGGNK